MKKLMIIFVILYFNFTYALETVNDEENCYITIKYSKDKKVVSTETLKFIKKNEKECKLESDGFKINFVPHVADKKEVSYKWIKGVKK